jgi:hypothetical protein
MDETYKKLIKDLDKVKPSKLDADDGWEDD